MESLIKCDDVLQEAQYSFELMSELTDTEHQTGEPFTREVEITLPLPNLTHEFQSDWMSLPTDTAENDTRWKVLFWGDAVDIAVALHCVHLQYPPASVRLLATVVGDPGNWTETAAILFSNSGSDWSSVFRKRRTEFGELMQRQVRVRVRWACMQLLPRAVSPMMNDMTHVQCRWQIRSVNTVRPTADTWQLWSKPFGSVAMWRTFV